VVGSGGAEATDVGDDPALIEEQREGITDGGCPHAAGVTPSASGQGLGCTGEGVQDTFGRRRRWGLGRGLTLDDAKRHRFAFGMELGGQRRDGGRGAMLDGQRQPVAVTTQVESAIAPGAKLGRTTQGLAGPGVAGLACRVHEHHGGFEVALELSQVGERHIEGEEGLAALGCTAHDADGLMAPQALDEPALLGGQ